MKKIKRKKQQEKIGKEKREKETVFLLEVVCLLSQFHLKTLKFVPKCGSVKDKKEQENERKEEKTL